MASGGRMGGWVGVLDEICIEFPAYCALSTDLGVSVCFSLASHSATTTLTKLLDAV